MAEWRDRGFVPDSDDEDETTASNDTQNPQRIDPAPEENFRDIEGLVNTGSNEAAENNTATDGPIENEKDKDVLETKALVVTNTAAKTQNTKSNGHAPKAPVQVIEDEDDFDELQQGHYGASAAAEIEAGLRYEARSADVRVKQANGYDSILSSPLTEPPSTPSTISPEEAAKGSHHLGHPAVANLLETFEARGAMSRVDAGAGRGVSRNKEAVEDRRPLRALRQRNPIQLHPYALESEMYRQTLKARGLKPLRIVHGQAEAPVGEGEEEEGQEGGFNTDEDTQVTIDENVVENIIHPPPSVSVVVPSATAHHPSNAFGIDGDDFPDVDSLLGYTSRGIPVQGYKRRKMAHTFSKKAQKVVKESDQLSSARLDCRRGENGLSLGGFDDDHMYDVPRSPPLSGSSTPPGLLESTNHCFRFPQVIPSQLLQTPITSSESGKWTVLPPLETTDSEDESIGAEQNEESQGTIEQESSGSEDEDFHQLERVQRKIRGVLPASWLRLDMKTTVKKPDKKSLTDFHRMSPAKNGMQRGVARPVPRSKGWSPDRTTTDKEQAINLSDGLLSDLESPRVSAEPASRAKGLHDEEDLSMLDLWGELEEDNRIDAMLPAVRRETGPSINKKTRQSRLTDGKGATRRHPTNHGLFKKSNTSRSYQRRITDHLDRSHGREARALKPAKFRPPKLSILDAPTSPTQKPGVIPNFLRLAARTVRSRKDRGRHSPSRKFIRLATREETDDACETLRNWREGTLAPAQRTFDSHPDRHELGRDPLSVRSGNEQGLARQLSRSEQGWKDLSLRIDAGKTRQVHRNTQAKNRQTLLDHITRRKPTATSPTHGQRSKAIPRIRWKKNGPGQGQLTTSLQATSTSRPAMLESLHSVNGHDHPQTAFQKNLSRLNHRRSTPGAPNVLLARFLENEDTVGLLGSVDFRSREEDLEALEAVGHVLHRQARKRRPRHLDVENPSYRQLSVPVIIEDDEAPLPAVDNQQQTILGGFGPFGTQYTTTFDITALPTGIFFHESTFVGSGEFLKSFGVTSRRDLDREARSMSLEFEQNVFTWGPWSDTISSQLGLLFDSIIQGVRASHSQGFTAADQWDKVHGTLPAIKSIVQYVNNNLSFFDPVDRISFLKKCRGLIVRLFDELDVDSRDGFPIEEIEKSQAREMLRTKVATYGMVISYQLSQIANHELVATSLASEIDALVSRTARRIFSAIVGGTGLREVRRSLARLRSHDTLDTGIRDDEYKIEALVVVHHIFRRKHDSLDAFWDHIREHGVGLPDKSSDVRSLDRIWHDIFTLLPLLEFDAQGVLETGRRYKHATDNWAMVKQLISRVLQSYLANPHGQSPTFNAYCRALLGRCFTLIRRWGWARCETIIGTLFDFFARNGLCHLRNEETHGSPQFLEHLERDPPLDLEREERCFHIFLKIAGTGLRAMRQIYPNKKIRDIVWRLMPNHGRQHPKDEAIRRDDLDALRNHHDLICTLYWASPPGFRPPLDAVRNLVHLESSHREACHINIKAWSNLVRFQLSVDEPVASLAPFADWYNDLWTQCLRQHCLARTEAEAQFKSAMLAGNQVISKEALESTITRNQKQVEAMLSDALLSLKSAMDAARGPEAAKVLLTTTLSEVFGLFDARQTRVNIIIIQALEVVLSFTKKCTFIQIQERLQGGNEDSQEYGDWSAFEDNEDDQTRQAAATHLHKSIYSAFSHLLSNLFGAEFTPDDAILLKTIDTWVALAQILVGQGLKSWDHYISRYGQDSWSSLRNTEQTRKCAAYFLSAVIEKEPDCYQEHKAIFLNSWVASLVERESLLRFQHRYTAAILNADPGDPVLKNLPFWTDRNTGRFEVSVQDFRERRLSLISCLLSNIRQSLEEASYYQLSHASQLRQEYRDLLKHLMAVMKNNYQELGDISSVRGAYVTFVQQVVQYLQQHTADICPIDQFFIDSTAFPLPATDPTYVVGRLKNYGLRLQEPGTPKQLAIFIQGVSERAAVDGQQLYLIDQLHVAMSNSFEGGNAERPTLRAFLVLAVFPPYIELALSTSSGWILAHPVLQALRRMFEGLLDDVDGFNKVSVASITSTITLLFASMQTSMELLIDHSGLLEQPATLRTLTVSFSMLAAALPSLDYVIGLSKPAEHLVSCITFFKSFALFAAASILGYEDAPTPYTDTSENELVGAAYSGIRQFTLHELRESLSRNWTYHEGRYYLVRGNVRKEVVIGLGLYDEEKATFIEQINDFMNVLGNMPVLGGEEQRYSSARQRKEVGLDDVYF
ncbi:hypothetical protein MMC08_002373 [Hypocenomyce scalaris]|nr:hypothetical protein [Hypocenomyce scalaris]